MSKIRYAVIGLGYISQAAMLPAFRHARRNSVLTALVSGHRTKRSELSRRYGVKIDADYDRFDKLARSGDVDAVYIGLPNTMHREFTVRAARAGLHVLCDKPLAMSVRECNAMLPAARRNKVRLMTAYRLHFEPANVATLKLVRSGAFGAIRFFSSDFSMQVKPGNIRTQGELGGGRLPPSHRRARSRALPSSIHPRSRNSASPGGGVFAGAGGLAQNTRSPP